MTELEVSFRTALHEERYATAGVLLAQIVVSQQPTLPLVQELRLHTFCMDLMNRRPVGHASELLQAARMFTAPVASR